MLKSFTYKIRNRINGKFSKGGTHNTFTKTGKVWQNTGALNLHLSMFVVTLYKGEFYCLDMNAIDFDYFENCDLIISEHNTTKENDKVITVTQTTVVPLKTFLKEYIDKKVKTGYQRYDHTAKKYVKSEYGLSNKLKEFLK